MLPSTALPGPVCSPPPPLARTQCSSGYRLPCSSWRMPRASGKAGLEQSPSHLSSACPAPPGAWGSGLKDRCLGVWPCLGENGLVGRRGGQGQTSLTPRFPWGPGEAGSSAGLAPLPGCSRRAGQLSSVLTPGAQGPGWPWSLGSRADRHPWGFVLRVSAGVQRGAWAGGVLRGRKAEGPGRAAGREVHGGWPGVGRATPVSRGCPLR